jgi:hypothetical protein
MSKFEIPYRLTEEQAKAAGETLARAFHDYSLQIYSFPDEDERSKKLPIIFEFLVRYGIMYGEVYGSSPNL